MSKGTRAPRFAGMASILVFLAVAGVIAAAALWFALKERSVIGLVVAALPALIFGVSLYAMKDALVRLFKFGSAWLEFCSFPFRRGAPADFYWWPPRGVEGTGRARFALRCVRERLEQPKGAGRQPIFVRDELWTQEFALAAGAPIAPGAPVPLRFTPPAELPASGDDGVTYELSVHIELPGVDFEERYTVPME